MNNADPGMYHRLREEEEVESPCYGSTLKILNVLFSNTFAKYFAYSDFS
jgi:hypothetical protein